MEEMGGLKELVVDLFVWYGLSFVVSFPLPFLSIPFLSLHGWWWWYCEC